MLGWEDIISGWACDLYWCLWKRLAFDSVDQVKITLTNVGGHHPIYRGPEYDKKDEGRVSFSLWLCWDIHLLLGHWCSWFSNLWLETGTYTIGPSDSQVFRFVLDLHHWPWHVLRHFSLHNHELILHNKSLCIWRYLIGGVSLGNPNTSPS